MSSAPSRHQAMSTAFVELADTLHETFDEAEFLQVLVDRCVTLLPVAAAGLLLADHRGVPQVVAASSAVTQAVETLQMESGQGPCLDCHRLGLPVSAPDLVNGIAGRWPAFTAAARRAGFAAVHTFPMRLRADGLGALDLFAGHSGVLAADTAATAQAFADVASIGLLQQRAIRHGQTVADQLQTALRSRIMIEQAKGLIAGRHGLDIDASFEMLRNAARSRNLRLSDLAAAVVRGQELQ
ncbi:ANTAR domain-containing protein [Actinoplanes sp. NPDC049599]|uniref:ANTAR domain-containing protein n=1 Tax=Actinoplanes sp. NPDC049599 TaxID=3363903 RepID=UPI00379CE3CA